MAFTYAIVDGFAIAFLLILFISTRDKSARLQDTRCFRAIVMMSILALLCDLIAWQLDGRTGTMHRYSLWVVNVVCYLLSGAMPLTWLYYAGLKMNRQHRITKPLWLLLSLPAIFLAVLSVSTPWTHWLFYIDNANVYQRGKLFAIQMLIPFAYIVAAALWALYRASKERLRQQRMEILTLSSFIVFPVLGVVLQLAFYGVSLAWPCCALSLMLVYVSMQNQKISLDALTGLNNRGQLDKHLYDCVERADNDVPFVLFMLDIDEFKKINDAYGHTAGDAALIDAATILKRALYGTNSFLARYGGDEFAIVLYYTEESQIAALLSRITSESTKQNESEAAPYRIIFSAGYACYDKHRYKNYQDMITAADAQMYIQKRQHKAVRY